MSYVSLSDRALPDVCQNAPPMDDMERISERLNNLYLSSSQLNSDMNQLLKRAEVL